MPNEVYKAAVKGLGALVAPQAARRLVDEALRASNRTSDDVSASAMRRLLLTRVNRELAGVLPDHVLMPSLERVAADLAMVQAAPRRRGLFGRRTDTPAAEPQGRGRSARQGHKGAGRDRATREGGSGAPTPDPFDSDELKVRAFGADAPDTDRLNTEVKKSSVYLPAVDLPEIMADAPGRPELESPKFAEQGAAGHGHAGGPVTAMSPSTAGGLNVPGSMVERVIRTFADLETVRQIVVINGMTVTQVRGEGLETDRLAALTVATRGLLNRAGDLRVFSLETSEGVLFLFPTRDGAIVVLTHPKVNIGAVLAARSDLEEAA